MSTTSEEQKLSAELHKARNFQTFREHLKILIKGCIKSKDFTSLHPHLPAFISHYEELFDRFQSLYLKMNKLEGSDDFLIIQNPEFQMSYIDKLPLFDGSDDKIEVFVIERYVNHRLVRKECHPISELQSPDSFPDVPALREVAPDVSLEDLSQQQDVTISIDEAIEVLSSEGDKDLLK